MIFSTLNQSINMPNCKKFRCGHRVSCQYYLSFAFCQLVFSTNLLILSVLGCQFILSIACHLIIKLTMRDTTATDNNQLTTDKKPTDSQQLTT